MSLNFTRIRLLVKEFKSCFQFYRDILGFPVVAGNENGPYAEFSTGSLLLALFNQQLMANVIGTTDKPNHLESQDQFALIFEVQDVNAIYNRLKNQGVKFVTKPTDRPAWGLRTAHFRDPDNNLIELYTDRPDIYTSDH